MEYQSFNSIIEHSITMKSYRSAEIVKTQTTQNFNKYQPQRKTQSPQNTTGNRASQYDQLAKKAKEQLKHFQSKRKVSPQGQRYKTALEKATDKTDKSKKGQQRGSNSPRSIQSQNIHHTQSQKFMKKEPYEGDRVISKEREGKYYGLNDDVSGSPKKKGYIDSSQYKKLHEKLDIIETKITDMKRNLQRKKQEKQKHQQNKYKGQKESKQVQSKKNGLKDLVTKVPQHAQLHSFNSNPYSPRHNVYYVSQLVRAYKDQQSLAREHLLNSLNILKMLQKSKKMSEQEAKKSRVDLPLRKGHEGRKTIVFDLDETLIHCNDTLNPPFDVKLPIKFPTGQIIEAGINIRPYAKQILKNLSKHFQIILFTASHACYANVVIDYLDPQREWVHHRLFRQHCFLSQEGMYVKDLRVIGRDLKSMVLVDNAAYSYAYQLGNGIPILPYYSGSVDFQLKMLQDYIMRMIFSDDMRIVNQNTFKLSQYKNYYTRPQKLVEQLYINP